MKLLQLHEIINEKNLSWSL